MGSFVDALSDDAAQDALFQCCGSWRWVEAMMVSRPFKDDSDLMEVAEQVWWSLEREDWLEAFGHHPRIGETPVATGDGDQADLWASEEQAGARVAGAATIEALAEGNKAYESRFGHVFLVCATGLTAPAMLETLRERLENPVDMEMRIAAGEQSRITRLRLQRLVAA